MTLTETRRSTYMDMDTQTMRATVFQSGRHPRRGGSEAASRRRRGRHPRDAHDDLRHRPAHPQGEYPVRPGLVIGHEPVGVIEELGPGVTGYEVGDRVLVGAITPCGQCRACLSGHLRQCGHGDGYEAIGGWRFGNTINGAQAEYLLVPNAQANLAQDPGRADRRAGRAPRRHRLDRLRGAESGGVQIGDAVVVFAQGPIGLCATAGARLMGASLGHRRRRRPDPARRWPGAWAPTSCSTSRKVDVVAEVKRLTGGGADVAIEALGHAGDVRERAALPAARRHAVEPRRLLRQAADAVRRLRGRPRRPPHRHHALPRRQGAHATPDRHGRSRALRPARRSSPTASRSPRSSRPTSCSATGATAC